MKLTSRQRRERRKARRRRQARKMHPLWIDVVLSRLPEEWLRNTARMVLR